MKKKKTKESNVLSDDDAIDQAKEGKIVKKVQQKRKRELPSVQAWNEKERIISRIIHSFTQ